MRGVHLSLNTMATQWTVLQVDSLRGILNDRDFNEVRNHATQLNQPDPVAAAIAAAVATARGKIAAGGYRLSRTAGSVPPSIERDVLFLALEDIWLRVVRRSLTDDQVRRIDRASKALSDIAKGLSSVETPVDPEGAIAAQQKPRGAKIIHQGKRAQIKASDLSGLI